MRAPEFRWRAIWRVVARRRRRRLWVLLARRGKLLPATVCRPCGKRRHWGNHEPGPIYYDRSLNTAITDCECQWILTAVILYAVWHHQWRTSTAQQNRRATFCKLELHAGKVVSLWLCKRRSWLNFKNCKMPKIGIVVPKTHAGKTCFLGISHRRWNHLRVRFRCLTGQLSYRH